MARGAKRISAEEAAAEVRDGSSLGLGGWLFNSQPMALVRALVRRGARDLDLVPSPGSIAPDLLIGAGCARSTVCVFISFEQFGLAPQFRRAAEAGRLKVHEMDGPGYAGGLRAAICDLPWMPIPDMATDLPRVNPDHYRALPGRPGERKLLAVAPIRPEVAFLHAQQADEFGNVQFLGAPFFDVMLGQAAKKLIVSVDRIVSTETIRRANHLTKLPAPMVDAVVEAPFGAHPTASPGRYRADEAFLADYVKACGSEAAYASWIARWVRATAADEAYLDALGGARLARLSSSEAVP